MKKQFILGFLAGAILISAGLALAKPSNRTLADFRVVITVVKANTGVEMTCSKGCAWETLTFACDGHDTCTSPINASGMTN